MKTLKYGDVYKLDYDRLPLYGTVCGRDGDAPIIVPMTTDTKLRDPNSVDLTDEQDGLTAVAWPYLPIRIAPAIWCARSAGSPVRSSTGSPGRPPASNLHGHAT